MPDQSGDKAKSGTGMFGDEEVFRLKVGEIVYAILKDRDLTVNEVNKLKGAIKESLELILTQHQTKCQTKWKDDFDEMANLLVKNAVANLKTELAEAKSKEDADRKSFLIKIIGLAVGVTGLFFTALSILLRLLGVL